MEHEFIWRELHDKVFGDPPNGGGGGVSESQTNRQPTGPELDPSPESESQTRWYQFRRLRERVRRFAINFWDRFEL